MTTANDTAFDLGMTPRNPPELLAASRDAWNRHEFPVAKALFSGLVGMAQKIAGEPQPGYVNAVQIPHPPRGRPRSAWQPCPGPSGDRGVVGLPRASAPLFRPPGSHVARAHPRPDRRDHKGSAVFVLAYWIGAGSMTWEVDGGDPEAMRDEVRRFMGAA